MKHGKKIAVRGLSSVVALSICGLGGAAISAFADAPEAPESEGVEAVVAQAAARVTSPQVVGTFSATQTELTPLDQVVRTFGNGSYNLCSDVLRTESAVAAPVADVMDWTISITGDVANPYAMTVAELQDDEGVQKHLMGCSCSGNPADGIASVNAKVTGVSVTTLLKKAGVEAGANTIVFTSADGYEVALPLSYVSTRMCPIVFDVNGSPIAESAGGTNQLWLGSTSARHFARDITGITLEKRQTPPPAPGSDEADDEYAHLPNVGVYFGGEIA